MRRLALAGLLLVTFGSSDRTAVRATADPTLPPDLASVVDPAVNALWTRFSGPAALADVQFVSQYWRLSGNEGYNATLDRMRRRLVDAGFADGGESRTAPSAWIEEYPNNGKGWSYSVGTLALARGDGRDEVVLSRANQNLSLCINSFSTPAEGVLAPLVDVGRGREADFAGKDVTGAVVLGDATAGGLSQAALAHGAIGVISTDLGRYISPDPPGAAATPRDTWNILQWGSIRYDESKKSFGFKATPRAAATLRAALTAAAGGNRVMVRVTVASTFSTGPNRMLIAEIPGRSAPNERVVITAHVQEPGANDNASGVATLTELARAMRTAIRAGAIPPPERTITFLWLEEISGSRQWLTTHADLAKGVRYMFSMDMTGEDVSKTGGSFLIERWPDPGAVWERPWDPHSEWGGGNVRENQLKGDLLNDLHLAVCTRVAAKTGWIVKTNPYEGGSDHSEFGRAGIPSVLNWHFTDRYYHSNYDTADKTSPDEMRNVGVAVAASAWLLASASEATSLTVANLVAEAGRARIGVEEREGQKLADVGADPAAARAREATIVQAWRKWYGEAIRSVSRLIIGPATPAFTKTLEDLATGVENRPRVSISNAIEPGERISIGNRHPRSIFDTEAGDAEVPGADEPPQRGGGAGQTAGQGRGQPAPLALEELILAADRLRAERWYPPVPEKTAPTPDEVMLQQALASPSARMRAEAVRALGRFESASDVPKLLPLLEDPESTVRREAAQAVAQSLKQSRGPAVLPASKAVQTRLETEKDSIVRAAMLEALARLRYEHPAAMQVAPTLVTVPDMLAILVRQDRQIRLGEDSLQVLRRLANPENPIVGTDRNPVDSGRSRAAIARDALEVLYLTDAVDTQLATWALRYHCAASPSCGWEIRYLATQQLDVKQPALVSELETLRRDASLQVRLAALPKLATFIPTLQQCRPFVDAANAADEAPMVKLEAIRLMDPRCNGKDEIAALLTTLANTLGKAENNPAWHVPARAMEVLVRFRPTEAKRVLDEFAIKHAVWQVRAAAARVAGVLKDEAVLLKLADDKEPNVRTDALTGLAQIRSLQVTKAAARALASDDHQLVRAAALALKGSPEPQIAVPALLGALTRLTSIGKDNSRDARIAILDRFKEFARSDQPGVSLLPYVTSNDLQPFLRDYDPNVATAAADVLGLVTGVRPDPAPTHRAPEQPGAAELLTLPTRATIVLDNGDAINLTLLPAEAPLTVFRFAKLAGQGYYDGLTFHRVVPLFVIQGGSPGANEYVGDARFMRDEIGFARHTRGAVGVSTRGRDTGDAQIFIDLTDQPRLNYDYTIFARVAGIAGPVASNAGLAALAALDAVLEGAKIRSISVSR